MVLYYLAKAANTIRKASIEFASKGLELVKCAVSSSGVSVMTVRPQPSYGDYVLNIVAFMKATVEQAKVTIQWNQQNNFTFKLSPTRFLRIPAPPVYISFDPANKNLSSEIDKLIEAGHAEKVKFGNKNLVKIFSMNPDAARLLHSTGCVSKLATPGSGTHLEGFHSYLMTLKIFTAFLLTHTYPAYVDTNAEHVQLNPVEALLIERSFWAQYRLAPPNVQESYSLRSAEPHSDVIENPAEWTAVHSGRGGTGNLPYDYDNHNYRSSYFNAKPSPNNAVFSGAPSEVPYLPGMVFAYFHGCLDPDHGFIFSLMDRYFLPAFGSLRTKDDVYDAFKQFKSAASSWMMTESGMILQHIAMGIQLAIQSQTRLFILLDNLQYGGFVLLGCGFRAMIQDKIFVFRTSAELRQDLAEIMTHSRAIRDLSAIVSSMSFKNTGGRQEVDLSTKNSRAIYYEIEQRECASHKDQIVALIRYCFFPDSYRRVNRENVCWALDCLRGASFVSPNEPLYLHPDLIFAGKTEFLVFGSFGPTAFSFTENGGHAFEIPAPGEVDPTAELKGRESLETIRVSLKPLSACIFDYNVVKKNRLIRVRFDRSSVFRNVVFRGEDRTRVWASVKETFGLVPVVVQDRKGKRKASPALSESSSTTSARVQKKLKTISFDF